MKVSKICLPAALAMPVTANAKKHAPSGHLRAKHNDTLGLISEPYEPRSKFLSDREHEAGQPPYSGTVYVEPDLFTADDPTTYSGYTYKGTGTRMVHDRRTASWSDQEMYLFDVHCGVNTVEFVVHKEFTEQEASLEVAKYGPDFGRMPEMLVRGLGAAWIMRGDYGWGGGGGNGANVPSHVLIHTGFLTQYWHGVAVEMLVHEAVHALLDKEIYADPAWQTAVEEDGNYISTYARDHPRGEDAAETVLLWLAVEYKRDRLENSDYDKILETIPHRINYLNNQDYDTAPLSEPPTGNIVIPGRPSQQANIK